MRASTTNYTYSAGRRKANIGLLILTLPYPLAVVALSVLHMVRPARGGPLALSQVFEAFFFFPLVLIAPFALARGMGLLRVVLLTCAVLYGIRFMPHVGPTTSLPDPDPSAPRITALSWNVAAGGDMGEIDSVLAARPADIVALVEAYPSEIENDPVITEAYPFRFAPQGSGSDQGIIVLSTYKISDGGMVQAGPDGESVLAAVWARGEAGAAGQVTVIAAHPSHGVTCGRKLPLPTCYNTEQRDAVLADIHAFAADRVQQGERLLLMGDFNITEREPAYTNLSSGLVDAYRAAGTGPGNSWSPDFLLKARLSLGSLHLPILRIDYQFSSPNLRPVRLLYDCTPHGSDHCIVRGTYEAQTGSTQLQGQALP